MVNAKKRAQRNKEKREDQNAEEDEQLPIPW